jgi:hypothetical protein
MELLWAFEYHGTVLRLFTYDSGSSKRAAPSSRHASSRGSFEIQPIDLSAAGDELTLSTRVTGKGFAYIFVEMLLKDPGADRFFGPITREHVRADRDRESGGLRHPDWDDAVDIAVGLRPSLRLLTDGVDSAFCCAVPEGYGVSSHRLSGLYTPVRGTGPIRARITIDSAGDLKGVVAFREQGGHSFPRALTPTPGDRFSPFVQVHTRTSEDLNWDVATALSTPLAFSDKRLRMVVSTPLPGDYLSGLAVEDPDGGLTRRYVRHVIG